jgi:hypothetical protein
MRQTQICAWLVVMSVAAAACSGEKFTPTETNGTVNEGPTAFPTAGANNRNHGGTNAIVSGASSTGESGKAASGGAGGSADDIAPPSTGGANAASGGYGEGGEATDDCPSGSITFRMLPGGDLAKEYLCDAGCGTGWLTITDAEGALAYSLFSACGTASCDSCQVQPCAAAACLPTPLTAEGSQLVWTGNYLAKDTCGAKMACQKQACVKPGKYKAKACAAINAGTNAMGGGCMPMNDQLCAEAEFEFPATKTVKLVLQK